MKTNQPRREFLIKLSSISAVLSTGAVLSACGGSETTMVNYDYGVASGDPLSDRVILWTHAKYQNKADSVPLTWQVATEIEFKNIVATKEASGDWMQIMEIMRCKPSDFKVYSGDDAISLPLLSLGLDGVVSVVGNAWPQTFGQMVRHALAGESTEARQLHYQMLPLMTAIFREGSPAGIKFILQSMGLCEDHLRLPLVGISTRLQNELIDLRSRFGKES